jgi:hypothetical protein
MLTRPSSLVFLLGISACFGCGPMPKGGGSGGTKGVANAVPNAFAALSAGAYRKAPEIVKAVDARAAQVPDDGYAHYYAMTMREWLITETLLNGAAGPEVLLEIPAAIEHGAKAYELIGESDTRVPAFVGFTNVTFGETLGDSALVRDGMAKLDEAIRRFPQYGLFLRVTSLFNYPVDSAEFNCASNPYTRSSKPARSA